MGEGDTLINAAIGGAIIIFGGGAIPFAPAAAGAVSGYLEGGDRKDGVRVGAYAGLIGLLPVLLIIAFLSSLLSVWGFGLFGAGGLGLGLGGLVVMLILAIYFVGLAALGGGFGNYVKQDTDIDL